MSDPVNTWVADHRRSSKVQTAPSLMLESWGFRWFAVLVVTLVAFGVLDRGDNPAWVDGALLMVYLVYWVSSVMCVFFLARFLLRPLWRGALHVLGRG